MYAIKYQLKINEEKADQIVSAELIDATADAVAKCDLFPEETKKLFPNPVIADCQRAELLPTEENKRWYIDREILIYDKIAAQAFYDGLKKLVLEE